MNANAKAHVSSGSADTYASHDAWICDIFFFYLLGVAKQKWKTYPYSIIHTKQLYTDAYIDRLIETDK